MPDSQDHAMMLIFGDKVKFQESWKTLVETLDRPISY